MTESSCSIRVGRGVLLGLWAAALVALLAGLGRPVVQRTQEARVLETAREMLVSGDWRQWMIPKLNGEVRLAKPPLAYWLAAGCFRVLGVNEFAGRLPFALAGWLTIALVYRFGKELLDARFGLFCAGMLATSYMFFKHFRLAETDSVAGLFVAAAMYWLWKGARVSGFASWRWFQLAGVAVGLAVLAKGPPGVFPVLFIVVWAAVERNWTALWRLLVSGMLLTAAVVAGWWFLYVQASPEVHVLKDELRVVAAGEGHPGPFYAYLPQLLVVIAPWMGMMVLGMIWAIRDWRFSAAGRVGLIWVGAILFPLSCIGNKQDHYLLPLTPGLAMLGAYALYRGVMGALQERAGVRWVMSVTVAILALAPVGVLWMARRRGGAGAMDWAVVVLIVAAITATFFLWRRQGMEVGAATFAAGLGLGFAVMFGWWIPSLEEVNHRTVAAALRGRFGDGPYVFYGRDPSFPLVWNLRSVAPAASTPEALERVLAAAPGTVVIVQTKNDRLPPPIPAQLSQRMQFDVGDEKMRLRIYVKDTDRGH